MFEHAIMKQWVVDSLINAPAPGDNTTVATQLADFARGNSSDISETWHIQDMAQRITT